MKSIRSLRKMRAILRGVMLIWIAIGMWNAARTTGDLRALRDHGRVQQAQVIGREKVGRGAPIGYVHYAFRSLGFAVENRFAVPPAEYPNYPTGRAFTVTYLPENPHTHRPGIIGDSEVIGSEMSAAFSFLAGLAAIGLPLFWVERALRWKASHIRGAA